MYEYTILTPTTLDKIVYKFYGDVEKTNRVLECNPELIKYLILKPGTVVKLPVLEKEKEKMVKRLWD